MDETTLVGHKYRADPLMSEGGTDGDPGNDLTDEVFYSKDGYPGVNRVYQADKNDLEGTGEVIKTKKDEDRSDVLPTVPQE